MFTSGAWIENFRGLDLRGEKTNREKFSNRLFFISHARISY